MSKLDVVDWAMIAVIIASSGFLFYLLTRVWGIVKDSASSDWIGNVLDHPGSEDDYKRLIGKTYREPVRDSEMKMWRKPHSMRDGALPATSGEMVGDY